LNDEYRQTLSKLKEESIKLTDNFEEEKEALKQMEVLREKVKLSKIKIKEERDEIERKAEAKKNELEEKTKYLGNLESIRGNKEQKIRNYNVAVARLKEENRWLADVQIDMNTEFSSASLESKKGLKEGIVKENKALQRNINKRVEIVADDLEAQCEELNKRKEVVLEDKKNLLAAINECNIMKEETVMNTFVKVDKAINAIFSTLLPGTKARLKPVKKESILEEGVELSVAFNDVWKNSLNELSGGQRSLLALSFILAMMKYKPAPIYILDEIDAALDLENTQNIGEMIKKHFKNSQFLIVSLKEQMTYNASAIFRVANVDGKSKVERIH